METTRRRLLRTVPVLPLSALAGCSAFPMGASSPTPSPDYEHLGSTSIYTSDDVGLRVPDRVATVDAPSEADLIVIHGNPAVDVEQAVTWLVDGRAVALLGDRAQSTWIEWTGSEPYRETFDTTGRSEADPVPHLIVSTAVASSVTTHRYSWGDLSGNGEILEALDDAMDDIDARTPG